MRILVISASRNIPSNSDYLSDRFMEGMRQIDGMEIEKIRLNDVPLDHFDLKHYDKATDQGETFRTLQNKIQGCDGMVIATPIWNFSMPAQLKNLIDRMGSFALDDTRLRGTLGGKPFYLIITGGSGLTGWNALMKKTTSCIEEAFKYFGMTLIGRHYEPKCTISKGVFGLVVDARPESLSAVREKGTAFAGVVRTFKNTGKLPTATGLYRKVYSFGQAAYEKVSKWI